MFTDAKKIENKIKSVFFTAITVFCIIVSIPAVNVKGEEASLRQPQDVTNVLDSTMAKLANTVDAQTGGSGDTEWIILCLARGGYYAKNNKLFTDYYNRIVEYVNTKAAQVNYNGALHKGKSTDNSRLILALSSIGKDSTKIGNWDITAPYEDFKWIKKQGINGPVFSLIALDTNNYQTEDTTIRQQCVDFILSKQLDDGGWALSGTVADTDITAMTLQSLYPYKEQPEVSAAAEKAFDCLSNIQQSDGGYTSWGTINSESCSQVIVALTTWGINPDTDPRFIKNDKSVIDAVLTYYIPEKAGFKHILSGNSDLIATEQACYALVAYNRFLNGKTSLYNMSDAFLNSNVVSDSNAYQNKTTKTSSAADSSNNKSPAQKRSLSPKTGDSDCTVLCFALMIFAAAGAALSVIKLKKEENK